MTILFWLFVTLGQWENEGFYKNPLFSVLFSTNGKPVMTDDTSYFICFSEYESAYVAMLFLNSKRIRQFLKSISFQDAKRPYTKKVLERIDFTKIYNDITYSELQETERSLNLRCFVTKKMVDDFGMVPEMAQRRMLI